MRGSLEDADSLAAAVVGVNTIISLVGTRGLTLQANLIEVRARFAMQENNVRVCVAH